MITATYIPIGGRSESNQDNRDISGKRQFSDLEIKSMAQLSGLPVEKVIATINDYDNEVNRLKAKDPEFMLPSEKIRKMTENEINKKDLETYVDSLEESSPDLNMSSNEENDEQYKGNKLDKSTEDIRVRILDLVGDVCKIYEERIENLEHEKLELAVYGAVSENYYRGRLNKTLMGLGKLMEYNVIPERTAEAIRVMNFRISSDKEIDYTKFGSFKIPNDEEIDKLSAYENLGTVEELEKIREEKGIYEQMAEGLEEKLSKERDKTRKLGIKHLAELDAIKNDNKYTKIGFDINIKREESIFWKILRVAPFIGPLIYEKYIR